MADITKCHGDMCPKKEQCYRYTATSHEFRQAYFMTTPIQSDGTCTEFWKDERHKIVRRKRNDS